MKSPPFDYQRASSIAQAMDIYSGFDGEALYLAGGQSILPSLALRLQAPALLIDISGIAELGGIVLTPAGLRIGAMTRHEILRQDKLVADHAPLLSMAAPFVAHTSIRNRATLGGNMVLADPASEFPAAVRASHGVLEIAGPNGTREVAADAFFQDLYTTALKPGEILVSITIPPSPAGCISSFDEIARRHGDFALVGAAIRLLVETRVVTAADICLHSVGPTPMRAQAAQDALVGLSLSENAIAGTVSALADDIAPDDDVTMPGAVRLHLAQVLLRRMLTQLAAPEQQERAA
ncbi:xanthine dehydrogenase family protein subunit M [Aureimonas fodinaquatilis]|uniref:Xanthine dehydrogenase family protein subunit M n=1 Tax=Aureimonas fodinaquatilis TaxID=2565783 RepID=A0A5B0E464_9HYPH|nr:xanthine dehydrogenase family protein subunit M [Aureimonas fodinaquatilis]KAA0972189.1 xanthine dehydrogenase family protein subunit M [Aureimonas fodinaquatilis]